MASEARINGSIYGANSLCFLNFIKTGYGHISITNSFNLFQSVFFNYFIKMSKIKLNFFNKLFGSTQESPGHPVQGGPARGESPNQQTHEHPPAPAIESARRFRRPGEVGHGNSPTNKSPHPPDMQSF